MWWSLFLFTKSFWLSTFWYYVEWPSSFQLGMNLWLVLANEWEWFESQWTIHPSPLYCLSHHGSWKHRWSLPLSGPWVRMSRAPRLTSGAICHKQEISLYYFKSLLFTLDCHQTKVSLGLHCSMPRDCRRCRMREAHIVTATIGLIYLKNYLYTWKLPKK